MRSEGHGSTGGEVREELLAGELALARRDASALPDGFGGLIHEDFLEIGSSGRHWNRAAVLEMLAALPTRPASIEAFAVEFDGGDLALVTYRAALPANVSGEAARQTLRSSLWLRRNGRWQIRFHQGTPIDEGAAS